MINHHICGYCTLFLRQTHVLTSPKKFTKGLVYHYFGQILVVYLVEGCVWDMENNHGEPQRKWSLAKRPPCCIPCLKPTLRVGSLEWDPVPLIYWWITGHVGRDGYGSVHRQCIWSLKMIFGDIFSRQHGVMSNAPKSKFIFQRGSNDLWDFINKIKFMQ